MESISNPPYDHNNFLVYLRYLWVNLFIDKTVERKEMKNRKSQNFDGLHKTQI